MIFLHLKDDRNRVISNKKLFYKMFILTIAEILERRLHVHRMTEVEERFSGELLRLVSDHFA